MNGKKQTILLALILLATVANLAVSVVGRMQILREVDDAQDYASEAESKASQAVDSVNELIENVDDLESAVLYLADEIENISD